MADYEAAQAHSSEYMNPCVLNVFTTLAGRLPSLHSECVCKASICHDYTDIPELVEVPLAITIVVTAHTNIIGSSGW